MKLKLKNSESVTVQITEEGKISLSQYDASVDEYSHVYLTQDQFKSLENWVFKNKDEIELAWNDGVENE